MTPEIHTNYFAFPRERNDELDSYLKKTFSSESASTGYVIADVDDGLVYLELKRDAVLPQSIEEFFFSLGGERIESKKDLDRLLADAEFMDALSPVDISRIRNSAF